jgi:transcriptional regulator with PAS, ATPase and Fis domain
MDKRDTFTKLLIGSSVSLQAVIRTARIVAATDATLLIQGESGTGKELLAEATHQESQRKGQPFIPVNCAALPETLAESELFGHRKGAFTGAVDDQPGRIMAASGGTLFLDEIGSLPLSIQGKFLRFLESGECQTVGHTQPKKVDVRVVVATNSDLLEGVKGGTFREDLYYRLHVVPVVLPPLRTRTGDLELLFETFMTWFSETHDIERPTFSTAAMAKLKNHSWPGNVRELRNFCERATILFSARHVEEEDLPPEFHAREGLDTASSMGLVLPEDGLDLNELEAVVIRMTLEKTNGNRSRAARLLNLSRDTLLYRIKKYAI